MPSRTKQNALGEVDAGKEWIQERSGVQSEAVRAILGIKDKGGDVELVRSRQTKSCLTSEMGIVNKKALILWKWTRRHFEKKNILFLLGFDFFFHIFSLPSSISFVFVMSFTNCPTPPFFLQNDAFIQPLLSKFFYFFVRRKRALPCTTKGRQSPSIAFVSMGGSPPKSSILIPSNALLKSEADK